MIVSILGYNAGPFFAANEVDTPYTFDYGVPYYGGHPWWYYGPSISLGFFFGNTGWWHGGYFRGGYHYYGHARVYDRAPVGRLYYGGAFHGRSYVAPRDRGGYVPHGVGHPGGEPHGGGDWRRRLAWRRPWAWPLAARLVVKNIPPSYGGMFYFRGLRRFIAAGCSDARGSSSGGRTSRANRDRWVLAQHVRRRLLIRHRRRALVHAAVRRRGIRDRSIVGRSAVCRHARTIGARRMTATSAFGQKREAD